MLKKSYKNKSWCIFENIPYRLTLHILHLFLEMFFFIKTNGAKRIGIKHRKYKHTSFDKSHLQGHNKYTNY